MAKEKKCSKAPGCSQHEVFQSQIGWLAQCVYALQEQNQQLYEQMEGLHKALQQMVTGGNGNVGGLSGPTVQGKVPIPGKMTTMNAPEETTAQKAGDVPSITGSKIFTKPGTPNSVVSSAAQMTKTSPCDSEKKMTPTNY